MYLAGTCAQTARRVIALASCRARRQTSCGNPAGVAATDRFETTKVTQNQWFSFTSENLKAALGDGSRITRIRVEANGWDYVGRADNVRLTATH